MPATLKAVPTPKPTASVVKVTPKMAADWIGKNARNRNARTSLVNLYARDMAAKNWQFTGEAIKFDLDGNLLDGQHRLLAIVKAGTTVPMLVIKDLATESQTVMDSGAKRTAADSLSLTGHKNASIIAAAARLSLAIAGRAPGGTVSHAEIADWVDSNPDISSAAAFASTNHGSLDLRPAVVALSFLTLSRIDGPACAAFFEALVNQATDGRGDPRSTLLRRLAAARRNGESLNSPAQFQFVVRAWNAWRRGENLHVLKTSAANGVTVSIPKAV